MIAPATTPAPNPSQAHGPHPHPPCPHPRCHCTCDTAVGSYGLRIKGAAWAVPKANSATIPLVTSGFDIIMTNPSKSRLSSHKRQTANEATLGNWSLQRPRSVGLCRHSDFYHAASRNRVGGDTGARSPPHSKWDRQIASRLGRISPDAAGIFGSVQSGKTKKKSALRRVDSWKLRTWGKLCAVL